MRLDACTVCARMDLLHSAQILFIIVFPPLDLNNTDVMDEADDAGPWSHEAGFEEQADSESDEGPWSAERGVSNQSERKRKRLPSIDFNKDCCNLGKPGAPNSQQPDKKGCNSYESSGRNADSIIRRLQGLQQRCRCHKSRPCYLQLQVQDVQDACQLYWSLSSCERGHLLRSLHAAAHSDGLESKTSWKFNGHIVCFAVFAAALGTSEPTLLKLLSGIPDRRKEVLRATAPHPRWQMQYLDCWFWELYNSSAEPMPEEDSSDLTSTAPVLPLPFSTEQAALWTVASSEPVAGLPRRHIQHCSVSNLYWQFVSSWEEHVAQQADARTDPPCYKTFQRRWQFWKAYIGMRKSSEHAQCQVCWNLQQQLSARQASWLERATAARSLRTHLRLQYLDRMIYWSMRWASQQQLGGVLCIIIDSMDKSKFSWPKLPCRRLPKGPLDGTPRPKFVLTCSIAHGYCYNLFLSHDHTSHGAAYFIEILPGPKPK
jgi:hypothetical protein